jgi:hypothetical protein
MNLDQLIAAMQHHHVPVRRASDAPLEHGWYVIASESAYARGGFSIYVTDSHAVITGVVQRALEALGFDVQHAFDDHCMEAWPRRDAAAR